MESLPSENLALARRFFNECWNEGRVDALTEIMAPEHVHHFPDSDLRGPENIKAMIHDIRTRFPDFHITIDDEIVGQDKVVLRWTIRGTHQPTGNSVQYTGIDIIRIANGRIVELWNQMDVVGYKQQLQK
jgi:predicted ester cyclase